MLFSQFLFSLVEYWNSHHISVSWIFIENLLLLLTKNSLQDQSTIAQSFSLLSSFQFSSEDIIRFTDLMINFSSNFPTESKELIEHDLFPANKIKIDQFINSFFKILPKNSSSELKNFFLSFIIKKNIPLSNDLKWLKLYLQDESSVSLLNDYIISTQLSQYKYKALNAFLQKENLLNFIPETKDK